MNPAHAPDTAVSEIVGALLLIAVISIAVSIMGVTILSNVRMAEIPAVSFTIGNVSKNITITHTGGDPLPAGSYRIYVDGTDRTAEFAPPPSSTVFSAGTTLSMEFGTFPQTLMVVSRTSDGKEIVLVQKFFS